MAWSPDDAIGSTEGLPFLVETFGRARVAVRGPRHNEASEAGKLARDADS
jgi:hypothetical protein